MLPGATQDKVLGENEEKFLVGRWLGERAQNGHWACEEWNSVGRQQAMLLLLDGSRVCSVAMRAFKKWCEFSGDQRPKTKRHHETRNLVEFLILESYSFHLVWYRQTNYRWDIIAFFLLVLHTLRNRLVVFCVYLSAMVEGEEGGTKKSLWV